MSVTISVGPTRPLAWSLRWTMAVATLAVFAHSAQAVTPESPEVRKTIKSAFEYLDANTAPQLGGKCLIALAYLKDGAEHKHPKLQEAVDACLAATNREPPVSADIYSTGIAIIYLCELDPSKYHDAILKLQKTLEIKQKPHGGWGYDARETGDTSMTQYGILSSWEASKVGFPMSLDSIERVTNWLLRTQDPDGNFGYQGKEGEGDPPKLVKQDSKKNGMTAAGLGCTYICADLLQLTELAADDTGLPAALKLVKNGPKNQPLTKKVDIKLIRRTQERGNSWMRKNYKIDPAGFTHYYLYALERYHSFLEMSEGKVIKEPKWYNEGYAWLKKTQKDDGSWKSQAPDAVDTAFGILFLLRSTKKSIERAKSLGDGTLAVGRGLPGKVQDVQLRAGKILAKATTATPEQMADALLKPDSAAFEDLTADPGLLAQALQSAEEKTRLACLAKIRGVLSSGAPDARFVAAHTLGRAHDLDGAATLIYALDDPDTRVAREANDALQFLGRKFSARLGENPTEKNRQAAIQHWKNWYLSIRPDAEFDN